MFEPYGQVLDKDSSVSFSSAKPPRNHVKLVIKSDVVSMVHTVHTHCSGFLLLICPWGGCPTVAILSKGS